MKINTGKRSEFMIRDDEKAILREVDAFIDTWNRGDAKALMDFHTEDTLRVGVAGDVQHGKAELEAAFNRLFGGSLAGANVKIENSTVRMLSPDLAIWQGPMVITPVSGSTLKGYAVQVMKKVGDRWLILEAHLKFFPPPRP